MKTAFITLTFVLLCGVAVSQPSQPSQSSHYLSNDTVLGAAKPLREVRYPYRGIEVVGVGGSHLYSGDKLNDFLQYGFSSFEARYVWQTTDKQPWARASNYPRFGIGWYSASLGDPKTLGRPNALYGFFNVDLFRISQRHHADMLLALGLASDFEPYNSETNPQNDAIGSSRTVYFDLRFGAVYNLTREMDITYGLSLVHFSNGRMFVPNHGLNLLGLYVGTRYNFNINQRRLNRNLYTTDVLPARYQKPAKQPLGGLQERSLSLYGALGTVQNYPDVAQQTGKRYATQSVVLDYEHLWNDIFGISVGADFFNDPSLGGRSDLAHLSDFTLWGAHVGVEYKLWRLRTKLQAGMYLGDSKGKGTFFLRPAARYDIGNRLFAQVGLKTRRFAADWVEFGIGFKPLKW